MRYDREMRRARQGEGERWGRGEYGAPNESTFHGYAMGYSGGALRSRGSFEAGQLRSGLNPRDEFEFRWGDGYVGGRGYGGTNYDLRHGYRVGGTPRYNAQRATQPTPPPLPRATSSPATRGGYSWSEYEPEANEFYGPARYGYGPYFERLRRRRRSDEEIRGDVEDALFYDTWVDADNIEVEVEDGIVVLRGTLPNFDEVRFATDDAWDVDGVRGVRSEFEVGEERGMEQRTASTGGGTASARSRSSRSTGEKQSARSSRSTAGKETTRGKKGGAGKQGKAE
jgi:hypothetical protein